MSLAAFLTLHDIQHAHHTPLLRLRDNAKNRGYESVCFPLTTESWKHRWEGMCLLPSDSELATDKKERAQAAELWRGRPAFLPHEVTATHLDEASGTVVAISDWLELDADDVGIRHDAEIALQQELSYASYLDVYTAILPAPRNRSNVASYARIINNCLKNTPQIYLSVRLPIYNPSILHQAHPTPPASSPEIGLGLTLPPSLVISPDTPTISSAAASTTTQFGVSSESEMNATWEMWDVIRSICDYNTRLTLTLDLTPPLPTKLGVLSKWAAESVRYIFLPASTFIANAKGYPVLPKPTQSFIRDCMIHQPTVILAETSANKHSRGGEAAYSQYIRFLEKTSPAVRNAQKVGTVENFAQGYQDYLQAPLQPLMDNLQSMTYQTFEQDPVKYERYEEAIFRALSEWPTNDRIVCCVAGAGRGPLIARCLNAIARSQKQNVFIYALEKNPSAYVTLQQRKDREWSDDKVKLIFGDMRTFQIPESVDILISELLGSFGDNELSPECLDGAQRFLKPSSISIPASYTSHLAPLSSSKLYNEARASKNASESLETPYVVMFQAVNILSEDKDGDGDGRCGPKIQECWEFEHPRRREDGNDDGDEGAVPLTNNHNVRSARLRFWIPHAGVLHGLAGYFEAVLYGTIGLSIHPQRKDQISKDMLSWFPLFFPFKEPLYLPSNSELQVSIWRLTNDRQVWYEWHAEAFLTVPIVPPGLPMKESSSSNMSATSTTAQRASIIWSSPMSITSPLQDDDMFFTTGVEGNGTGSLGSSDGTKKSNRSMTHPQAFGPPAQAGAGGANTGFEVVKIGHTSLHNPGGRSSWIGL